MEHIPPDVYDLNCDHPLFICNNQLCYNIPKLYVCLFTLIIAESDILSLGYVLCGSGGSIYKKDTIQNTLSAFIYNHLSSSINRLV
jgi:hypothetical protein